MEKKIILVIVYLPLVSAYVSSTPIGEHCVNQVYALSTTP